MSKLSDSDSSDSSNEFLVPADQIDLTSPFFNELKKSTGPKKSQIAFDSSDDSDFDDIEEDNVSSAELLAQVLKNLESTKAQNSVAGSSDTGLSTSSKSGDGSAHSKEQILDLLLQGETGEANDSTFSAAEHEVKDEIEDVKNEYTVPKEGISIHLPGEDVMFGRNKKKKQDLQVVLKNKINQRIRTSQVYVHKVGLLCWLSHGFHLNQVANDPELLATSLSLVSKNSFPKGRVDLKYLEQFTKWFKGLFTVSETHKDIVITKDLLLKRILDKNIFNYVELILLFIATLRGMGINCRLVISLYPPNLKPRQDQMFQIETDSKDEVKIIKKESSESSKKPSNTITKKLAAKVAERKTNAKGKSAKSKETLQSQSPAKSSVMENSVEADRKAKEEAKKRAAAVIKKTPEKKSSASRSSNSTTIEEKVEKVTRSKANTKKQPQKMAENHSDDEKPVSAIARKLRLRTRQTHEAKQAANKITDKLPVKETKIDSKRSYSHSEDEFSSEEVIEFSTDDEYEEKKPKKRVKRAKIEKSQNKSKRSKTSMKKPKSETKLLSSDEDTTSSLKNSFNVWVEVYVESEESWISISVLDQKIHCISEIHKKALSPVLYVVAWNSSGTIKDVTRRYCHHWLTDTRKKRVEEKWWNNTLSPWKERKTALSKAEDEQLLQHELEQPLPKTLSECKGHPLYVLARHLLKYEALYPPDVVPLGHLAKSGEAIYSRHCVHTLYSRETWVKKARVVKPAQEAYKTVKAMPKYDKLSGQKLKNQPLELFGKWQTDPYIPPEAKDGKVPRNEYGNVDLFKMCMLPKGTVYINLPGLNRIARKLNIDCAPACVGFNFGCRGALPAFEGFVVCKEYEDTMREAWEAEQIEASKRAKEKREKRIYGNWKKLIKGLLIRERLAAKYAISNSDDEEQSTSKTPSKPEPQKRTRRQPAASKKKVKA